METLVHEQQQYLYQQEVTTFSHEIVKILTEMENGVRGYSLTGNREFLQPFSKAETKFDEYLKMSQVRFSKSPQVLEKLNEINSLKNTWISGAVVKEMMARKKLDRGLLNLSEFSEIVANDDFKAQTDKIRKVATSLIVESTQRRFPHLSVNFHPESDCIKHIA